MTITLLQGDCLELMRTLPAGSVDAVVTDPPYSSGGFTRGDRTQTVDKKYVQTGTMLERPLFAGDNRDQRGFSFWATIWMSEAWRVTKDGAPICVFSDWRQLPITTDILQAGGFVWRGIAPWNKTEATRPSAGRFRAQCEYVVWGSKGPMQSTGSVLPGFFEYVVKQSDKFHMTGKPTSLIADILGITKPDAIVLDPFAGSGTTGVACVQTGRNFIGMEIDPTYFTIAEKRIRDAQQQMRLPLEP